MKVTLEDYKLVVTECEPDDIKAELLAIGDGTWHEEGGQWIFPMDRFDDLRTLYMARLRKSMSIEDHLKALTTHMVAKGYSKSTIKSYHSHLKKYLLAVDNYTSLETFDAYMGYLVDKVQATYSYCNQAIGAIKLHGALSGLIHPRDVNQVPRPVKHVVRPSLMNEEQVEKFFSVVTNERHKTAFMLAYLSGLKVSEVASLKLEDLDEARMLIYAGPDRRPVPMDKKMLSQLAYYRSIFRPHTYVFQQDHGQGHITTRSLQKAFVSNRRRAGLGEELTFHSLRHTYAMNLVERGTGLDRIRELLGHTFKQTTEHYLGLIPEQ